MLRRPLVMSKYMLWRPSKGTWKSLDPGFLIVEIFSECLETNALKPAARDAKLAQSYQDDMALFRGLCFLKCPNFGSNYWAVFLNYSVKQELTTILRALQIFTARDFSFMVHQCNLCYVCCFFVTFTHRNEEFE